MYQLACSLISSLTAVYACLLLCGLVMLGSSLMTRDEMDAMTQMFFRDAASMCCDLLTRAGYSVPQGDDPDQILLTYFNVLKRRIPPGRRRVWYSREFQCADVSSEALRQLAKAIQRGDDINPYQSRSLQRANFNDLLLNDWGIHHLHLGTKLNSTGFVDRTGPLLYARVDPGDVYCLTVAEHGNWSMQEFVRIIHRNWPEVIARYRLHGLFGETLSDANIATLRGKHVNSAMQMPDSTVYRGPGGGYASDGTSFEVSIRRDHLFRLCRHFAALVRDNVHLLVNECAKQGVNFAPPYRFRLRVVDGNAQAIEENYNAVLRLATPLRLDAIT